MSHFTMINNIPTQNVACLVSRYWISFWQSISPDIQLVTDCLAAVGSSCQHYHVTRLGCWPIYKQVITIIQRLEIIIQTTECECIASSTLGGPGLNNVRYRTLWESSPPQAPPLHTCPPSLTPPRCPGRGVHQWLLSTFSISQLRDWLWGQCV